MKDIEGDLASLTIGTLQNNVFVPIGGKNKITLLRQEKKTTGRLTSLTVGFGSGNAGSEHPTIFPATRQDVGGVN